jgi:hypothetical protein
MKQQWRTRRLRTRGRTSKWGIITEEEEEEEEDDDETKKKNQPWGRRHSEKIHPPAETSADCMYVYSSKS